MRDASQPLSLIFAMPVVSEGQQMVFVFGAVGILAHTDVFRNTENLLTDNIAVRKDVVILFLAGIGFVDNLEAIFSGKLMQLFLGVFTQLCSAAIICGKQDAVDLYSCWDHHRQNSGRRKYWEAISAQPCICVAKLSVQIGFRHQGQVIEVALLQCLAKGVKHLYRQFELQYLIGQCIVSACAGADLQCIHESNQRHRR